MFFLFYTTLEVYTIFGMVSKILFLLSFIISLIYIIGFVYVIIKVAEHPARNFGILWILPFFVSVLDYFYLAISLLKSRLNENKIIIILFIAVLQSISPIVLFCLMFSPKILFTFNLITNVILYIPIILLLLPICVFFNICKNKKK